MIKMIPAKAVLEALKGLTSTYLIPVFDVFWLTVVTQRRCGEVEL